MFFIKSCEGTCANVLKSVGANGYLIHPFDNVNVIAGQGTIGLEVLEQVCLSVVICRKLVASLLTL